MKEFWTNDKLLGLLLLSYGLFIGLGALGILEVNVQ